MIRKGHKVVYLDPEWIYRHPPTVRKQPQQEHTYTVREVIDERPHRDITGLLLEELSNPVMDWGWIKCEPAFDARAFVLVQ